MGWQNARRPPLTLQEAARIIGVYRWVEMSLFETLGGWVPDVPELEVKLIIAAHAPHHAWHSTLWRDRLPVLAGVDRDELTVGDNAELVAFMDALVDRTTDGRTIEKLVGVYRVLLPRMIACYTGHLERASAVSDAPTIRSLKLVLGDDLDDWTEGEGLIQALLVDEAAVRRAAEQQARLEALWVRAGGIGGRSGPVDIPAPGP